MRVRGLTGGKVWQCEAAKRQPCMLELAYLVFAVHDGWFLMGALRMIGDAWKSGIDLGRDWKIGVSGCYMGLLFLIPPSRLLFM